LPLSRLLHLLSAVLVRSQWQIAAVAPTAVVDALVFSLVCTQRRNPVEQRRAATVVDCSLSSKQRRLLDARAVQHPAAHQHHRVIQLQPLIAVVAKPLLFRKQLLHAAAVEPLSIPEASPPHRPFHQHPLLLLQLLLPLLHQLLLRFLPYQQLRQHLSRRAMFQRRNSVAFDACSLSARHRLSLFGV
jgi:hypothetical protein